MGSLENVLSTPKRRTDSSTDDGTMPSLSQSNRLYDELSSHYDQFTSRLEPFRRDAHAALALREGMTVVDVGCGTGKSIEWLSHAVGSTGQVIALEPSAAMLDVAKERLKVTQLTNVSLHLAPADALGDFTEANTVDAFLLMFTHDVLQSSAAIDAMLHSARRGARFSLAGGKFYPGALRVLNPWVKSRQRPYCTTFEGYDAPWRKLFSTPSVATSEVRERYLGIAYTAHCTLR